MSGPLRDVIFDIGNVLLFFDFRIFARKIAPDCLYDAEELLARLEQPVWEMEARGLRPAEFFRLAAGQIGYQGGAGEFVAAWQEIFEPNEALIRFAERLKEQGHRLFLLSNTNPWHAEYFLARYPVFELFDDHVFSHEEVCAKPEPRIYQIATERFGVNPAETIYIDDRLENVEAGRSAGYRSIHYQGQEIGAAWDEVNGCKPESTSGSRQSPPA